MSLPTDRVESHRSRWAAAAALVAALVLGAYLRFGGLSQTGIFGVDDGRYILDGLAKANELQVGLDLVRDKWSESRGGPELLLSQTLPSAFERLSDPHPFAPKTGYAYAIAVPMLLGGFDVSLGNFLQAGTGVLLILATFVLARCVRDKETAAVAALVLAVSGYHVYFSRTTYPQCISSLFLMAAVWSHLHWHRTRTSQWPLIWCGLFSGLSFWTNYQVAGALPFIPFIHIWACWRGRPFWEGLRDYVLGGFAIAFGFLCVIAAAELATYPMILLFRTQGLTYPQATFLELLWPRLTGQAAAPFNPSGLVLFPYFVALFHGAVAAMAAGALLVTAVVWAVSKTGRARMADSQTLVYLIIPFAIPFLIFSTKTMQGARMFTYGLPFFAALVAVAIVELWRTNRRGIRVFVAIGAASALVSNALALREVRAIRSAYPEVAAFVEQQDERAACAGWSSVLTCYLHMAGLEGDSVYRYLGQNIPPPRWFVNDWQELYEMRYPDEPIALVPGAMPAYALEHRFGRIFLEAEALPSYGNAIANIRWVRALDLDRARQLLIYDLQASALRTRQSVEQPDSGAFSRHE